MSALLHAPRLAMAQGMPLNIMMTLNATLMGVAGNSSDQKMSAISEGFRKWVTRPPRGQGPKVPALYVWNVENPSHLNMHFLAYIPPSRIDAGRRRLRELVERHFGPLSDASALHFMVVDYAPGVAEYMAKGAHPAVAQFYGFKHEHQGWVRGPRLQVCRALNRGARQALQDAGLYRRPRRRYLPKR